jgi:hypothetical protein
MENREIALSSALFDPARNIDRCEPPTPPRPASPVQGATQHARRSEGQGGTLGLTYPHLQSNGCSVCKHQHPAARRVSAPAKAGFILFVAA